MTPPPNSNSLCNPHRLLSGYGRVGKFAATLVFLFTLPGSPPPARAAAPPPDLELPMPMGSMPFNAVEIVKVNGPGKTTGFTLVEAGDPAASRLLEQKRKDALRGAFEISKADGRRYMAYFLGQTEVTMAQWCTLMETEPETPGAWRARSLTALEGPAPASRNDPSSLPVTRVTMTEIRIFLERYNVWLNNNPDRKGKLPGIGDRRGLLRLPLGAEWEFAARGGLRVSENDYLRSIPYPEGAPLSDFEWYRDVASSSDGSFRAVGTKKPNPLGLCDMLGNVREIMGDGFHIMDFPGGIAVRAGSADTDGTWLTVTTVRELPELNTKGMPSRTKDVGFRIAIGSELYTDRNDIGAVARTDEEIKTIIKEALPPPAPAPAPTPATPPVDVAALRLAADAGDSAKAFELASHYRALGDELRAIQYFEKSGSRGAQEAAVLARTRASQLEDADSLFRAGRILQGIIYPALSKEDQASVKAGDLRDARKYFALAAGKGHAESALESIKSLWYGRGVPINPKEARAQCGLLTKNHPDTPGLRDFILASDNRIAIARRILDGRPATSSQADLAELRRNFPELRPALKYVAQTTGNILCQLVMAAADGNGERGKERENRKQSISLPEETIAALRKGFENCGEEEGYADAQVEFGYAVARGLGSSKDLPDAVNHFRRAQALDNPAGTFLAAAALLGYGSIGGISPNQREGLRLLDLCVRQELPEALALKSGYLISGKAGNPPMDHQQDRTLGLRLAQRAADQGSGRAYYILALNSLEQADAFTPKNINEINVQLIDAAADLLVTGCKLGDFKCMEQLKLLHTTYFNLVRKSLNNSSVKVKNADIWDGLLLKLNVGIQKGKIN